MSLTELRKRKEESKKFLAGVPDMDLSEEEEEQVDNITDAMIRIDKKYKIKKSEHKILADCIIDIKNSEEIYNIFESCIQSERSRKRKREQ